MAAPADAPGEEGGQRAHDGRLVAPWREKTDDEIGMIEQAAGLAQVLEKIDPRRCPQNEGRRRSSGDICSGSCRDDGSGPENVGTHQRTPRLRARR